MERTTSQGENERAVAGAERSRHNGLWRTAEACNADYGYLKDGQQGA